MVDESRRPKNKEGVLSAQTDELLQRIVLYERLQKQFLQMRLGTILLLLCMSCLFIFGLYHRATHLHLGEMQSQVTQKIATATPIIGRRLTAMGQRVLPIYSEVIQLKAGEKLPIFIKAASEEAGQMLLHIENNTKKRINDEFMGILEREGNYILGQFPELEDEEAVMQLAENVRIILTRSLKNVAMEKLDAHLDAICSIQIKLAHLKEEIKRTPEQNVELKLLAVTLELIGKKLTKEIYAAERERRQ